MLSHIPLGETFSRFQKSEKLYWILKCSKDFLPTINGKGINWTPSEILRISLRGKHFEGKNRDQLFKFLKCSNRSLRQ